MIVWGEREYTELRDRDSTQTHIQRGITETRSLITETRSLITETRSLITETSL